MILHLGYCHRLAKVKGDGGVSLPLGGAHLDVHKEGFYKTIEQQSENLIRLTVSRSPSTHLSAPNLLFLVEDIDTEAGTKMPPSEQVGSPEG